MNYEVFVSLITLISLEIVLGIDNVIFISIIADRLPKNKQQKATRLGILLAALMRLALLAVITYILRLSSDLFVIFGEGFSAKDIILICGGMFLLYKSTKEIYKKMEGEEEEEELRKGGVASFRGVVFQILIMDLVFSVDSIITAIGLVREVWVMYVAVITAVVVIFFAAGPVSRFVNKHPAFKMLALSFLVVIGVTLISEGMGAEIPKGYIYFSMAFAFLVDVLQMRMNRKKKKPLKGGPDRLASPVEPVKGG
jgi:predicted tellurium resistance membrane protein TerC